MKETREVIEGRINDLLKGLDKDLGLRVLEQLVDDLCITLYGVMVTSELKRVKMADYDYTCIQPLANGRAILISSYGFKVKTDTKCKCGRAFIVLDENNKEDNKIERENRC